MKKIKELFERILDNESMEQKVIAIAAAEDYEVLETVKKAIDKGIAKALLVGDGCKIRKLSEQIGLDLGICEVIETSSHSESAAKAVELVKTGRADIIMKGQLHTSEYLKAILNRELGIKKNKVLSLVTVMEIPKCEKLVTVTDCGMNIKPNLSEKIELIKSASYISRKLGNKIPKVACLSAVESVNLKMDSMTDYTVISKMAERGQIKSVEVDGPLSLDLALSKDAVKIKGIKSNVAGEADVLLMPDILAGNIFYKAMMLSEEVKSAAVVMGATHPIVITSRADSSETKLNSIALAMYLSKEGDKYGE